jgi:hypothetical protein
MRVVLPPLASPPVPLLLAFVRAGVCVEVSGAGKLTWVAARRAYHRDYGYFDKDEQGWVSYIDADVSEDAAASVLAAAAMPDLLSAMSEGYNAYALDAWLRGDPAALAYADAARAWQDAQRSVAWRFSEVFQALALLGAGRTADALAVLGDTNELTLWHALATLHGYRSDVDHMRAVWAVSTAFSATGRPFPTREREAVAALTAAGLPPSAWRPTGHPGVEAGPS